MLTTIISSPLVFEIEPNKMISESEKSEKGDRKKRSRKKALLNSIRQQIEFYLSDANLARDRFFSNLLKIDNEIEVQIFLNCNRIRALTSDQSDIVKSIEKSEVLGLTDDQKRIFRKTSVSKKENADLYTIYVEGFGSDMTMDRLKDMFQKYGKIDYVSFPCFKTGSKQSKGFAFIEFVETDAVEKVITVYAEKNAVFDTNANPSNLSSVVTHGAEKQSDLDVSSNGKVSGAREVSVKRLKTEPIRKKVNSANTIRIARKTVWKKLRNKYLTEQRKIGNLVVNSLVQRDKVNEAAAVCAEKAKIDGNQQVVEKQPPVPIAVDENKPVAVSKAHVNTSLDGFIVKFHLNDCEFDKKQVSKTIKSTNEHIQFVDLKNKNPEGFLRFSGDLTIAKTYCQSDLKMLASGIFKRLELLNDAERQRYLLSAQEEKRLRNAKIADRARKRAKKPKVVVSKSIKFKDDDDGDGDDEVSSTTVIGDGAEGCDMVIENV